MRASVDIDLAELERLDTFGAWLIERLKRHFHRTRLGGTHRRPLRRRPRPDGGAAAGQSDSRARQARRLKPHTRRRSTRSAAASPKSAWSLVLIAQLLGRADRRLSLGTIAHPSRLRLTSIVHQLERVGWRAVPIILLSTFLIGAILAQQGIFRFRDLRRRRLRRRHGQRAGAARSRRADRLHHGRRPLRQRLHRRDSAR